MIIKHFKKIKFNMVTALKLYQVFLSNKLFIKNKIFHNDKISQKVVSDLSDGLVELEHGRKSFRTRIF